MNPKAGSFSIAATMLAGCIATQTGGGMAVGTAAEPQAPAGPALVVCAPPMIDVKGSSRRLDVNYWALGLTEVQDITATAGCDVMLQVTQTPTSWNPVSNYVATSVYSGAPIASGRLNNTFVFDSSIGDAMRGVAMSFAPGTANYQRISLDKRKATRVGQRTKILAPPARQQQIDAAAQEGDAALAAGKGRIALAAYGRALSGPWSDDETSRRIRNTGLKLVGEHPEYAPPVPEEARMHMVRAQAILKDSTEFEAYDEALGEMGAAAGVAPWWSDIYYNAALVAEKAGYVDDAIGGLKAYLLANPRASDARAVQDKIYALEVKQERAGRR
jgi:hypothetical protein